MKPIDVTKQTPSLDAILPYLGYRGQPMSDALLNQIQGCIELVMDAVKVRFVCDEFTLQRTPKGITLQNTALVLTGADITRLLEHSDRCFLIAATIGGEVDRLISRRQSTNMAEAVLMDAIATAAIEALCDEIEAKLREQVEQQGLMLTWRFSCGYGDLPLDLQPTFLTVLNASRRAGITCTASHLMVPTKSVTAVMGISRVDVRKITQSCRDCPYRESCGRRKAGKPCGA